MVLRAVRLLWVGRPIFFPNILIPILQYYIVNNIDYFQAHKDRCLTIIYREQSFIAGENNGKEIALDGYEEMHKMR